MRIPITGVLAIALSLPLSAATFDVNSTVDAVDAHPGDGICASAAGQCTLRAAIMESNALAGADTVRLIPGVYRLTLTGAGEDAGATGDLDVTSDTTITGAGAPVTVVDGLGLDRVFDVAPTGAAAVVTISDLTIQNGAALIASAFVGGGVASRGTLTLRRCVIAGNVANSGGGVDSSVSLVLDQSVVEGNATADSGFTNASGGGVHAQGALTVSASTIANNRTTGQASAIGGGIWNEGGTFLMTNSTVTGNWSGAGGGIYDQNGNTVLVNVTIAGNGFGGLFHGSFDGSRKIRIRNSILANSFTGFNCNVSGGTLVAEGRNLDSGSSCGFGGTFEGVDPRLGPLADNGGATETLALLPDSPVIEGGTSCTDVFGAPLVHDQRGVLRPGGACSLGAYQLEFGASFSAVRTIPIVLDVVSGATGARFGSELTLANRGTSRASLRLVYTAASILGATGSGTVFAQLAPGEQLVVADAIAYLRGKGLDIPPGNQGGTLSVVFNGLSTSDAGFAGARTTAPSGPGRAGLSYPGPRAEDASGLPVRLFGLRDTGADRTNLALLNAGTFEPITLRVTLVSGAPGDTRRFVVPPATLAPGQWTQINAPELLRAAGFANAWAIVERIAGADPYLAYAVFNDNVTNDGSYVAPVAAVRPIARQLVPVLVESATFDSELVLANPGEVALTATLSYVQSLGGTTGLLGTVMETLQPHEQKILPRAIQYLRDHGITNGTRGTATFVGTLGVSFAEAGGDVPADGFAGARTAAPSLSASGGQYGLFYSAVPISEAALSEAWIFGLAQNDFVRANLALANIGTGRSSSGPITLRFDVFEAGTGRLAGSSTRALDLGGWTQINAVLGLYSLTKGYIRVVKIAGDGRFVAYGVVNDGKDSGSGTNDGSYVAMTVVE